MEGARKKNRTIFPQSHIGHQIPELFGKLPTKFSVRSDFDLRLLEPANTPQEIRNIIVTDYLKPSIKQLAEGSPPSYTTTIEPK